MGFLSEDEMARLDPAESVLFPSPIPVQSVSSDEFMPAPQTPKQREFELRVKALGSELAKHQGTSRRRFFKSASGMAAAFVAMNQTYGPVFGVSLAEAATPDMANERAKKLSGQFIMDMHTHFLRDDTRIQSFLLQRQAVGKAGWNPAIKVEEDGIFIQDGPVWTSAGMTACIDLALALVEGDLGLELSRAVARKLVIYHRRAGGQSQFSALLAQIHLAIGQRARKAV